MLYLAGGGVLTAAYLWFPPLKASGPLINVLGLSSSVAIAVGRAVGIGLGVAASRTPSRLTR